MADRRKEIFHSNRLRSKNRKTDGFGIFLRTVWKNGLSKQTECKFLFKPSEKKARKSRRKNKFFSNRLKNEKENTDGRAIFLQSVGKARKKSQTDAQFFL
jgi:hypothetical protein